MKWEYQIMEVDTEAIETLRLQGKERLVGYLLDLAEDRQNT